MALLKAPLRFTFYASSFRSTTYGTLPTPERTEPMPDTLILTPQQIIRKKAAGEPIEPHEDEMIHQHTITVLVENTIGALIRVVNMFSARGFNIESIAVGETDDPSVSRMNIVTTGNDRIIAQILRQLSRLIDTIEVHDLTNEDFGKVMKLVDALEDDDDVQKVYHNINITEDQVALVQ